jgi:hypothetical protein
MVYPMKLSVLCISKGENFAMPFLAWMEDLAKICGAEFVIAADGDASYLAIKTYIKPDKLVKVHSKGYLESVLEEAVFACRGKYVLRLDDDERASQAMLLWLWNEEYTTHDHWQFPRMHMWPDDKSVILTPQLFPDYQTRLSIKEKSGGRHFIHDGSPFGGGEIAPVAIEHHKFIAKTYTERKAVAANYDSFRPGYGTGGMTAFSLPEDVYSTADIVAAGDGFVPWTPKWRNTQAIR